jgi:hypothetical protein
MMMLVKACDLAEIARSHSDTASVGYAEELGRGLIKLVTAAAILQSAWKLVRR